MRNVHFFVNSTLSGLHVASAYSGHGVLFFITFIVTNASVQCVQCYRVNIVVLFQLLGAYPRDGTAYRVYSPGLNTCLEVGTPFSSNFWPAYVERHFNPKAKCTAPKSQLVQDPCPRRPRVGRPPRSPQLQRLSLSPPAGFTSGGRFEELPAAASSSFPPTSSTAQPPAGNDVPPPLPPRALPPPMDLTRFLGRSLPQAPPSQPYLLEPRSLHGSASTLPRLPCSSSWMHAALTSCRYPNPLPLHPGLLPFSSHFPGQVESISRNWIPSAEESAFKRPRFILPVPATPRVSPSSPAASAVSASLVSGPLSPRSASVGGLDGSADDPDSPVEVVEPASPPPSLPVAGRVAVVDITLDAVAGCIEVGGMEDETLSDES